jgi:hypothetical protein
MPVHSAEPTPDTMEWYRSTYTFYGTYVSGRGFAEVFSKEGIAWCELVHNDDGSVTHQPAEEATLDIIADLNPTFRKLYRDRDLDPDNVCSY